MTADYLPSAISPSLDRYFRAAVAEAYNRGRADEHEIVTHGLRTLGKLNGSGAAVMKALQPEPKKKAPPTALAAIAYTMHTVALDCARRGIDAKPELQALASLASHPASIDKFMQQTGLVSKSFRRLARSVDAEAIYEPFWIVRKGVGTYDESKHPRGKNGRWIAKDAIQDAKSDPVLAEKLRDAVKPEDAGKLEDALSGKVDLGRTKAGERKFQTQQKRETKRNSAAEVMRITRAMQGYGEGEVDSEGNVKHNITAEHLEGLAEHLPNLTVAQLKEARLRIREKLGWGRSPKHKDMVDALTRWAQVEASKVRAKEKGEEDMSQKEGDIADKTPLEKEGEISNKDVPEKPWELLKPREGETRQEYVRRMDERVPKAKEVRNPTPEEIEGLRHDAKFVESMISPGGKRDGNRKVSIKKNRDGSLRVAILNPANQTTHATADENNTLRQVLRQSGYVSAINNAHLLPEDFDSDSAISVVKDKAGRHPMFADEPDFRGKPVNIGEGGANLPQEETAGDATTHPLNEKFNEAWRSQDPTPADTPKAEGAGKAPTHDELKSALQEAVEQHQRDQGTELTKIADLHDEMVKKFPGMTFDQFKEAVQDQFRRSGDRSHHMLSLSDRSKMTDDEYGKTFNQVGERMFYITPNSKHNAPSPVVELDHDPHDRGAEPVFADDAPPVEAKKVEEKAPANAPKKIDLPKASAKVLNSHIEKLSSQLSTLGDELIAAGRGHETTAETMRKDDELSKRWQAVSNDLQAARSELRARKEYHGGDKPIVRKAIPQPVATDN